MYTSIKVIFNEETKITMQRIIRFNIYLLLNYIRTMILNDFWKIDLYLI